MKSLEFRRRAFLSGLAGAGLLVPFLGGGRARADTPLYPKRLVVFLAPSCGPRDLFWPRGSDTAIQLSTMTEPLRDLLPQVTFVADLSGLSYKDSEQPPHMTGAQVLTGIGSGGGRNSGGFNVSSAPSVDQFIAESLPDAASVPFRSLYFKNRNESSVFPVLAAPGQTVGMGGDMSPAQIFTKLFAGRQLDPGRASADLERLRAERRSVLDYLGGSIESFAGGLGTDDRNKVMQHLQTVRDLERQLEIMPTSVAGCAAPTGVPTDEQLIDGENVLPASWPAFTKAQLDLGVAALSCNLTQVLTIQWSDDSGGDGGYSMDFSWLGGDFASGHANPENADPTNDHWFQHEAYRNPAWQQMRARMEGWYVERYAYLLKRLSEVPEGAGSLLDNTAVLFLAHQGMAASHNMAVLPCMIAGRCGGALKPGGRLVRLGSNPNLWNPETSGFGLGYDGTVPHNRLLATLCQAMGVPVNHFNNPSYGGPLSELLA